MGISIFSTAASSTHANLESIMAKYEITKSIDVDELNKRSGLPTGKKRTLPFGAIIMDRVEDREMDRFTYLGELYRTKTEDLNTACRLIGEDPVAAAAPAPDAKPAGQPKHSYKLQWEALSSSIPSSRAKVPGGWLVAVTNGGLTFFPDPGHEWDGSSL
jgi:hypothetical protein